MIAVRGGTLALLLRIPINVHECAFVSAELRAACVLEHGRAVLIQVVLRCVVCGSWCAVRFSRHTEAIISFAESI